MRDGNQITVTDGNNNTTTYAYDSRNELTTVTNALGNSTVYGYDADGNQHTVTDALGHTATTLYDALNRATTMISAVGGTTTITYDAAGRETSLTDPDGNKTQWAYDADDRLTTHDPAQRAHRHLRLRCRRRVDRHDRRGWPPHDLFVQRRWRPDRRNLGRRLAVRDHHVHVRCRQRADRRGRQLRHADVHLRLGRQPAHGGHIRPRHPASHR